MRNPLVSVLMPVYNGEKYLPQAIDSILQQSFKDFEFLIINDGSTDNSEKIIQSCTDPRIRYYKNETNIGVVETLNKGLSFARGTYIARMDCDDISLPERLEKQVKFLNDYKEYGVVGSFFGLLGDERQVYAIGGVKLTEDEDLRLSLIFGNIYCHGETMFRKSLIDKYNIRYNKKYVASEDYDFWIELSKKSKIATIPEVLYLYMVNPEGESSIKHEQLKKWSTIISESYRKEISLPNVGVPDALRNIEKGRKIKDEWVVIEGGKVKLYAQLSYQVFLFRLGKVYLKKRRLDGILLFMSSFFANPVNWARHFFKMF